MFWQRAAHVLLLRPFLKLFCGVNVIGRSHLRGIDHFILIANHNSHFDVALLFYILPLRHVPNTHVVADLPYFSRSPVVKRLVEFLFDPVWIARDQRVRVSDPLADIGRCLDDGCNVILFPEGTRGAPGEMQHFKSGIGRLSMERPTLPIVPVFLSGPERALPRQSNMPLPFWQHVVIGPPQAPAGSSRDVTTTLELAVIELSKSAAVQRQKPQRPHVRPPLSVAILGIDGSGKSTQARRVAQLLSSGVRSCVISDTAMLFENGRPRELQPFLGEAIRRTISARAKKAGSLSSYKLPKLTDLFLRDHLLGEVQRWYGPHVTVMDGSPLLNIVAWSAIYKPDRFNIATCQKMIAIMTGSDTRIPKNDPVFDDFPELRHIKRFHLDHLSRPDIVVFLDVDPKEACRRIDRRGEPRQAHETPERLAGLRAAYFDVCTALERRWRVPTMTVEGERTSETISGEIANFCNEIRRRQAVEDNELH